MTRARFTVDPAFAVASVDERMFGSFVEHIGRCVYTGIYEPGHPTADERRVPRRRAGRSCASSASRSSAIRAATSSPATTGRTASARASERPARLDLAWRSIETNAVRHRRVHALGRRAGVEPMLAVNLGTRGVDAARDARRVLQPSRAARRWSDLRVAQRPRRSRTASSSGASATRWTGRGRSARRPRSSTAGWRPRPARR